MPMKHTTALTISTTALVAASPSFAEKIDSPAWDLLEAVEVEEIVTDTSYEVRKVFPAEIKDGIATFDITGFAVSLDGSTAGVTELMLVSDMGFCPFCGDPDHGTALQVSLTSPIADFEDGARLSLRGSLEAVTDPQTWQSAIMRDAAIIEG